MHILAFSFLLAASAQAENLAEYAHVCIGSMKASLTPGNLDICRKLAESNALGSADRSTIYLQLAVAEHEKSNTQVPEWQVERDDFRVSPQEAAGIAAAKRAREDIQVAIKLNPQDAEPVLFNATNLNADSATKMQSVLEAGLMEMPGNPLLSAALAAYSQYDMQAPKQLDRCVDALNKAPKDFRVQSFCASVYLCQRLMQPAKSIYERLVPQYQHSQRMTYGLVQYPSPLLGLAVVAREQGRHMAAVDYVHQAALEDPRNPLPVPIHQLMADELFEAHHYAEAASEYQVILLRGPPNDKEGLKARLVVALMLAGDRARATQLVTPMFAEASKGAILKYQIQLQKYVAQDVVLNGLADEPTLAATHRCLDQGCQTKH